MPYTLNTYKLEKTIELKIGKVHFYKNFLISELNEGVTVGLEEAIEISKFSTLHFKNQPMGYISNRVNSYSVVPVDYLKIKKVLPNIKAFAAVTYSEIQNSVIDIENAFLDGKLANFKSLEEAIEWVQLKIEE